jgi:predicted acetyltransferase
MPAGSFRERDTSLHVTLSLTSHADSHVVTNMFTAYFYELAQFDENLIINDHGLPMWAPFGGEGPRTHQECVGFNWWIRDRCELWLVRADGRPAGFTIILRADTNLPEGVDIELMDFYITPKYRRQGVGVQAARAAFDLYHGRWVVYQLERNLAARAFWQQVIGDYTGGAYQNLSEGTEQRFTN